MIGQFKILIFSVSIISPVLMDGQAIGIKFKESIFDLKNWYNRFELILVKKNCSIKGSMDAEVMESIFHGSLTLVASSNLFSKLFRRTTNFLSPFLRTFVFVEQLSEMKMLQFLTNVSEEMLNPRFYRAGFFLILQTEFDSEKMRYLQHFNSPDIYFPIDSKCFLAEIWGPTHLNVSYFELFSIRDFSFIQRLGEEETFENYIDGTPCSRMNYKGTTLRAAATNQPYDAAVTLVQDGKLIRGLGVRDIQDLQTMLNFKVTPVVGSIDLEYFPDSDIGRYLLSDEADVSIIHNYHLIHLMTHFTPLHPWGADRLSVNPYHQIFAYFFQPNIFSLQNVYLYPFSKNLWLHILIMAMLIYSVFIGFYKLSVSKWRVRAIPLTFSDYFLWLVCIFSQRGFYSPPKLNSLRILNFTGAFFSTISYSIYSASLISFLMSSLNPINSYLDLKAYGFTIMTDPDSYYSYMFLDVNESESEYRSKLIRDFKDLKSPAYLLNSSSTYFEALDVFYKASKNLGFETDEICSKFSHLPLGDVKATSGFFVNKHSPYRDTFNMKILRIKETGNHWRNEQSYYREATIQCLPIQNTQREVNVSEITSAFIFFGAGLAVAFSAYAIEWIVQQISECHYRIEISFKVVPPNQSHHMLSSRV